MELWYQSGVVVPERKCGTKEDLKSWRKESESISFFLFQVYTCQNAARLDASLRFMLPHPEMHLFNPLERFDAPLQNAAPSPIQNYARSGLWMRLSASG